MNNDFDKILDECIDRMNNGQSIDECLKLYPDYSEQLEPLLRGIGELYTLGAFTPSEATKAQGRLHLNETLNEIARERNTPKKLPFWRLFGQRKVWAPVTATLLLLALGLGLFAAFHTKHTSPQTAGLPPTIAIFGITPTTAPKGTSPTTVGVPPATTIPSITPTTTPGTTLLAYTGALEIRVTDAPAYNISAVNITLGNIEVHKDQVENGQTGNPKATDDTGWQTVIEGTRSFELLELRGGIEKALGSSQLQAGHYTQIRMDVKTVVVTVNGQDWPATLPSGKLRLVSSFDVEASKTTVLTMDIDASKSVVITGNGKAIFKPVVKLIVAQNQ